jgi:hypothetical protein
VFAAVLHREHAFTGVPAIFLAAGFNESARRSPTRPILRSKL